MLVCSPQDSERRGEERRGEEKGGIRLRNEQTG
jgi:hypothetical protein